MKKAFLKCFAKFTGKYMCRSLFFFDNSASVEYFSKLTLEVNFEVSFKCKLDFKFPIKL